MTQRLRLFNKHTLRTKQNFEFDSSQNHNTTISHSLNQNEFPKRPISIQIVKFSLYLTINIYNYHRILIFNPLAFPFLLVGANRKMNMTKNTTVFFKFNFTSSKKAL